MSKYLDPKADLTFKKVFGEHKNLVLSLLNSLLPMPQGMRIESVEYLSPENHSGNAAHKYSIVDVKCKDNFGRYFYVEMQNYWTATFFKRTLYNTLMGFGSQLERGESFADLKSVYALSLVNDFMPNIRRDEERFIHEYYFINRHDHEDVHDEVGLVFVELPKFRPSNRAEDRLKDLWLKFLTEIDDDTVDVDEELLSNPDTKEALAIVERAAYSRGEMESYNKYWLDISTERSALEEFENKGLKRGREEGLQEGIQIGLKQGLEQGREEERRKAYQDKLNVAKSLCQSGVQTVEQVATLLGLPVEDVRRAAEGR